MTLPKVAAIDVHKKVLMVVLICLGSEESASQRRFATTTADLRQLAAWLQSEGISDVVMESTAQYWKPVWRALEPHFRLHLAQAQSNKAPHGRKHDFGDANRLGRRFLAGELILSFVPEPVQRSWRKLTRGRVQLVRDRVRLQNQVEALLEQTGIKLSSVISDLFGQSGRRMLQALAKGETDPQVLAALGDRRLHCAPEQLQQALNGHMSLEDQELLTLWLEHVALLDRQIARMEALTVAALREHQEAVARLTEVPGISLNTALGIVAEVGPRGRHLRQRGGFSFLGRGLSGTERERRGQSRRGLAQGQSAFTRLAGAGRAGGGQNQRQPSPVSVPPLGPSARISKSHLGHRPPPMPHHLENPA
jgi:transposase